MTIYSEAHQKKWTAGFTLVEVMIVVVIIAILASIAIPSYQSYILRARRTSATSGLQQVAQMLERNMTANNCYNFTTPASCAAQNGSALTLSPSMSVAPTEGTAMYNISFELLESTRYILRAVPIAGSSQVKDTCGTLTITQAGVRGQFAGTVATCWGG
jgi:type IV pilus assembly protein PilE